MINYIQLLYKKQYKKIEVIYEYENPGEQDKTEPTTEPTEPTKTTEVTLYGDANNDGVVTIADASAILQYIANSDKYPLSKQGAANADVNGIAGVTADDAIVIQKIEAKLIKQSDLPLKA